MRVTRLQRGFADPIIDDLDINLSQKWSSGYPTLIVDIFHLINSFANF